MTSGVGRDLENINLIPSHARKKMAGNEISQDYAKILSFGTSVDTNRYTVSV